MAKDIAADGGYSAQFCAYVGGELVADIWGGPDAERDSIQGVFSSTKGVSAVAIALLVQRGVLDLDALMSKYWPEFAQAGKSEVTVRMALSHQAGIPGAEPQVTLERAVDHEYMAARLAAQFPHWRPGAARSTLDETVEYVKQRRSFGRPLSKNQGVAFPLAQSWRGICSAGSLSDDTANQNSITTRRA